MGWIVYFFGEIEAYVISSISSGVGGVGVVGYELALQYAAKNIYTSALGGARFARHVASGHDEVKEVILRPLCAFDIPEDDEEADALGRKMHLQEGLLIDYTETVEKTNDGVLDLGQRTVNKKALSDCISSLGLKEREVTYRPLNHCHPASLGYDSLLSPRTIRL